MEPFNTFLSDYPAANGIMFKHRVHAYQGETEQAMQARDADLGAALMNAYPLANSAFYTSHEFIHADTSQWARASWWSATDVLHQIGISPEVGERWPAFIERWLTVLAREVGTNPPI